MLSPFPSSGTGQGCPSYYLYGPSYWQDTYHERSYDRRPADQNWYYPFNHVPNGDGDTGFLYYRA